MLGDLTGWHMLIILAVVLLLFGATKLPALSKGIGQSIRIFRNEMTPAAKDTASAAKLTTPDAKETTPAATVTENARHAESGAALVSATPEIEPDRK